MQMTDANQRWDVQEAIEWMKPLAKHNIHWIEEPTSPDDIYGHKAISEVNKPLALLCCITKANYVTHILKNSGVGHGVF